MAFITFKTGRRMAFVLAMTFCGADAQAQSEAAAPRLGQPSRIRLTLDADNLRQVWTAVMKTVGPYDKAQKCWTLAAGGRRFCMRPARFGKGRLGDNTLYLFAISGREYEPASLAGGVAMFVSFATSDVGEGFRSEGADGLYEFGAGGAPPRDSAFKLVEAGAQTYAWEVSDSFSGAGSEVSTITLIHAAGRVTPRRKIIARFNSYEGDQSSCKPDTGVKCVAREIRYAFKPGLGPLFDLEMKLTKKSGTDKIFAANDASPALGFEPLVIAFDMASGQYRTPGLNMLDWLERRPVGAP